MLLKIFSAVLVSPRRLLSALAITDHELCRHVELKESQTVFKWSLWERHDSHSFRRHRLAAVTSYLGLCTYMRLTDPLPPFLDLTVSWKLDIQPFPEEATSGPYPVAFVNKAAYHCHLRSQLANTSYDDWFSITFSLQWKFSMAHLIILKEKCIAFLIQSFIPSFRR